MMKNCAVFLLANIFMIIVSRRFKTVNLECTHLNPLFLHFRNKISVQLI